MLANFGIWTWGHVSTIFIFIGWVLMVVPQSFVLFSRLHLVMHEERHLRWIFLAICVVSACMSIPTLVLGILGVSLSSLELSSVWLNDPLDCHAHNGRATNVSRLRKDSYHRFFCSRDINLRSLHMVYP